MSDAPELYTIRGFQVVVENSRPDIATPDVLSRLDEALALVEHTQPWRLAHLRRDLARFWIVRYPCRGAFFPESRTCMTELTFLARRDITAAPVAASSWTSASRCRRNSARRWWNARGRASRWPTKRSRRRSIGPWRWLARKQSTARRDAATERSPIAHRRYFPIDGTVNVMS